MFLYFIQVDNEKQLNGPVKIGIAVDVKKRMAGIQVGNHKQLRLLKALEIPDETAGEVESRFHLFFKHTALRGEWFQPTPFMLRHIDSLIVENGEIWDTSRTLDEWLSGSDIYNKIADSDHVLQVVLKEYMEDGNYNAVEFIVEEILDTIARFTPMGKVYLKRRIEKLNPKW